VRRWDARQRTGIAMVGGAIRITEADDDTNRVPLEDGIVVQFALPAQDADAHRYRVGDYWTIPARVATGDILWPRAADGTPLALAPQGIRHHYAPLGWQAAGGFTDLRHRFARLARCARA
jgi:hypothetical protein